MLYDDYIICLFAETWYIIYNNQFIFPLYFIKKYYNWGKGYAEEKKNVQCQKGIKNY